MNNISFLGLTFVGLVLLLSMNSPAQEKQGKKERADRYYKAYKYGKAAKLYKEIYQSAPSDKYALFRLAQSYRKAYNYEAALKYYEKCVKEAIHQYPVSRYWHAVMLKSDGQYGKAKYVLEAFFREFDAGNKKYHKYSRKALSDLKDCNFALSELDGVQKFYNFKLLPESVNTENFEHAHTAYPNDTSIIVTSAKPSFDEGGKIVIDNSWFEKDRRGWDVKERKANLQAINSGYNIGSGSFTRDRKKFYFTRCSKQSETGEDSVNIWSCRIYVTRKKDSGWTSPEPLNNNINPEKGWSADPSVSPDGDTLFFVSKRSGGYGEHDIWISTCNGNDRWTKPENPGKSINTSETDRKPFYDSKEGTLYFASEGRVGFGGLDIYKTPVNNLGKVENVGKPFNSPRDDFHCYLGEEYGYVVSNRKGGKGYDDIYQYHILPLGTFIAEYYTSEFGDADNVSLAGSIWNENSGKPVGDATVMLKDLQGNNIKKVRTSKEGEFRFQSLATHQGYQVFLKEQNPDFTGKTRAIPVYEDEGQPAISDKKVASIKKGATGAIGIKNKGVSGKNRASGKGASSELKTSISKGENKSLFENIYFETDEASLSPEAKKVLQELAAYYEENPGIQIEMNANTDYVGSSWYNKQLSRKRGEVALTYLQEQGVDKSAIVINAKGQENPCVTNSTPIGRQLNRRIEFDIVGSKEYPLDKMVYIVQPGETLYAIAKKYNMKVETLKEWNNLESNNIRTFQPLRVARNREINDDEVIAPVIQKCLDNHSNPEYRVVSGGVFKVDYYKVRPGNTLYSIARLYGIPVKHLKEVNNLESNTIRIGQTLEVLINVARPGSFRYVVQSGETLQAVARKFNMKPGKLRAMNDLEDDGVYAGQRLKVKISDDIPDNMLRYVVGHDDTFYSIAARFGLSVSELKKLNRMEGYTLKPGKVLRVDMERQHKQNVQLTRDRVEAFTNNRPLFKRLF